MTCNGYVSLKEKVKSGSLLSVSPHYVSAVIELLLFKCYQNLIDNIYCDITQRDTLQGVLWLLEAHTLPCNSFV